MPHPLLQSAIDVVTVHLGHNAVATADVPSFIRNVYRTLTELDRAPGHLDPTPHFSEAPGRSETAAALSIDPAVPISESITPDYIVCLEDGKKLRMLKRYLMTHYGMTPDMYRAKWGLPADYPMAAPALSAQRRAAASKSDLGRRSRRNEKRKTGAQ